MQPDGTRFNWTLLGRLYRYGDRHARKRRLVFVTSFIRAFQRPLLFWATAAVINGPIARHDWAGTLWGSLGFLALALSTLVVLHLRSRHQNELGEALVHDLRNDYFDQLQRQSISFFSKTKQGRLISHVVTDLEAVRRGAQLLVFIGQEFVQLLFGAMLMAYYNWVLFLVILAFAPVLAWGNHFFHPRLHRFTRAAAESGSRLTSMLAESLRGMRVIQGFARQGKGAAAFDGRVSKLAEDNVLLATENALYAPLLGITGQAFLAALLVVGGTCAVNGWAGIRLADFIAFFFLPTSFFMSVQAAASYYPGILASQVGIERLFSVLDTAPTLVDAPHATPLPDPRSTSGLVPGMHVRFNDVSFSYLEGAPVLRNVSFEAPPGRTVALVGHTGSGKSTLVSLLAKLHESRSGEIVVDGRPLSAVTGASLRAQMGIVHQSNFLFSGTVLENLKLGRPDASAEEVRAAASSLDCLDLLEALPRGLETPVGENGTQLSSGQRQLVCFVRALLAKPRLLILDEATSAIDPVTEFRIQRALERLVRRQTTFVVAHRLSTIVRADLILVLENGTVVERGSHAELLNSGGAYAALYQRFRNTGVVAA